MADEPKITPAETGQNEERIEYQDDKKEPERGNSVELDKSNLQDYGKVDKELAKYVAEGRIEITEQESTRLRRLIDRRVLVIMITTYFLQAIDKGTMSFASIMGIREDTNLIKQEVGSQRRHIYKTFCVPAAL